MNNPTLIRSIIIYAVCVPLAVFMGYQLTSPMARSTYAMGGLIALALVTPWLLRWHHLAIFMFWSLPATLFFIQGQPPVWMLLVALSLVVSILQRATDKNMRFIVIPKVTWALVFMAAVILATAHFTGGIGIRALGSGVYGGKRYVFLLAAILGYFALTAQRIPPERAGFYVAVFFLGGLAAAVGDMFIFSPSWLQFVFWVFPPNLGVQGHYEFGGGRLAGVSTASAAFCYFMLARYGIRGVFSMTRPWRAVVFVLFTAAGLLGGFRTHVIFLTLVFLAQFFLEGLHRTKWLAGMTMAGIFAAALIIPLAPKLPFAAQRALAFLPLNIDPLARLSAQESTTWRLQIWKAVLPEVPEYFWLGRGYALSVGDFDFARTSSQGAITENWNSTLVGDYHNGPLSVILTFGIWGAIAFLWFIVAALRVLYLNYRHGPPELQGYNRFLLGLFATKFVFFMLAYGTFHHDMTLFAAWLGLSVSLNGGVCQPEQAVVPEMKKPQNFVLPGIRPMYR